MQMNKPINESKDHELVLMSTMVKKFLNNKGKKPTQQGPKKAPTSVTCYNCQGKGHFAKDCKKEKVERPKKEDNQPPKEEKRVTTQSLLVVNHNYLDYANTSLQGLALSRTV